MFITDVQLSFFKQVHLFQMIWQFIQINLKNIQNKIIIYDGTRYMFYIKPKEIELSSK